MIFGAAPASADDEASNVAYVKTSKYGRSYAKCIPAELYGSKGWTIKMNGIVMDMKEIITIIFLLAICSTRVASQSHAPEQSLKITIVAAQNSVMAGDPIKIAIRMKNISDHDITMVAVGSNSKAELNYEIIVRDKNGEMLNETIYGKGLKGGVAGSRKLFTLKPGAEITETSNINKLYDMSMPGEYVIQVERELPASEGKGTIKSNTITVTVTP